MNLTFKKLLTLGCFILASGGGAVGSESPQGLMYVLEGRSETLSGEKWGYEQYTNCCAPLVRYYFTEENWNFIDVLYSRSPDCGSPHWNGSYWDHSVSTFDPVYHTNYWPVYDGHCTWSVLSEGGGYSDWADRDDFGWWVNNGGNPLYTYELTNVLNVEFWITTCQAPFWWQDGLITGFTDCDERLRTNRFPACSSTFCLEYYLGGTNKSLYYLNDEFTTLFLIDNFLEATLTNEWSACGRESPRASLWLSEDEVYGERANVEVRLKIFCPSNEPFSIDYLLCRQWLSNDVSVITKTKCKASGQGTGAWQYVPIQLPAPYTTWSSNGCTFYRGEAYWVETTCAGGSACASGQCNQSPGSASAALTDGGPLVEASLGPAAYAEGSSSIALAASSPTPALTTPAALQLVGDLTGAQVLRDNGVLRQVKNAASRCLADIQAQTGTSFTIKFYTNFGGLVGGFYDVSGAALISTITVAQGTSANQLLVDIDNGSASQYIYDWAEADKAWTMTSGNGLRKETRSWSETAMVRTNTIRDSSNNIVYQEVTCYTNLPNHGRVRTKEIIGPSGPALTMQYFYYDNEGADGTNYGSLKLVIQPSGSWQRYEYDSLARVTKEISQFLNAATNAPESQCRVVQYDYTPLDGGNPSQTRIEKLLGSEISRQYSIEYPSSNRDIRCVTPGAAWTAQNNLVTLSTTYAEGPFAGRPKSVLNPDGTLQLYLYHDSGAVLTTTNFSGAPNGTLTAVTNGTATVNQTYSTGEVMPAEVWDVALHETLGMEDEIDEVSNYFFDALGRHFLTTYRDDTLEQVNFNCCGIDSIVDRQGVTTIYLHDALKRQVGTIRNGVTTSNLLDAAGNVLGTFRVGTDGTSITNSRAVFDVAGRLTFETNAFGGYTSFTETTDGSGRTVKTTTFPDGGTRIETYYQDGSLQKATGTAVFPVRYEYGIEDDGDGATNAFTKEIRLDAAFADTAEWTKTYTGMLGQAYKTVYSAPSAPFPFRKSFYNSLGQLSKEIDPDGVITLYQYNTRGELEYTAIDMDRDGQIDFAGTDRITRTVSEYVRPDGGDAWHATSTYVWNEDGIDSPVLVSLVMASTDGKHSLSMAAGVTNSTEIANDWYNAQRTTTSWAPDGSRTISQMQCGTNYSTIHRDTYFTILDLTYACDAFGRQNQVAEKRPDDSYATNVTFFNAADQVAGTGTPAPAGGQGPQVTTNFFENMGRVWRTRLADNTSVTNEYFPNGLLKKTYGSRTYPVEYTYDPQGRMKTMKTWQNFAGNSGIATTTWNYDGHRGWLRGKVYADGRGPLYTNTPAGRLYTRTWARLVGGQPLVTTYGHNNAGDLATVSYSDGSAGITYGCDRQGRRTSAAQGATTQSFALNEAGLLLSESFSGGPLNGLSVTNSHDQFLRRTNLALLKSSTPAVEQSFSYDAFSRLQTASEGTSSATYTYVAYSSRVGQIDFSHDSQAVMNTTKQYDGINRLTNITTLDASQQVLDSHVYGYNAANQRTNHVLRDSSFWVYTYDGLGQVTSGRKYWPNGTPVAGLQFTYGFDDIGNRKTAASGGDQQGLNLHGQNYTANNLNQYTSRTVPGFVDVTGSANSNATVTVWGDNGAAARSIRQGEHFYAPLPVNNPTGAVWLTLTNIAVLPDGANPDILTNTTGKALLAKTPEPFTYDLDGNLTSDGLWANTWNAENRRTNVESRTTVPAAARAREQWTYLPDGRWIERIVSSWNGSAWVSQYTNRYIWDGQVLMGVLDHTNGVVLSFLRGLDLSGSIQGAGGVGGLLAVSQFWDSQITNSHFACFDGNGNVMALVAANDSTLSSEYEYGPFGESIRVTGAAATANPIGFSTKYADDMTGEHKYLSRDYNSSVGRWSSRDPIGERGGENLYGFVLNNPVSRFDILGLSVDPNSIVGPDIAVGISRVGPTFVNSVLFNNARNPLFPYERVRKNGMPLALLASFAFNNPGFRGNGVNRFLFTCKCGWIDNGHFWASALGGHGLGADTSFLLGVFVEEVQGIKYWPDGWRNSTYTAEDLPSDLLGSAFGQSLRGKDYAFIPRLFEKLLKDCGAIDPGKLSPEHWKLLRKEAIEWERDLVQSHDAYPKRAKACTALCPGTKQSQDDDFTRILQNLSR